MLESSKSKQEKGKEISMEVQSNRYYLGRRSSKVVSHLSGKMPQVPFFLQDCKVQLGPLVSDSNLLIGFEGIWINPPNISPDVT